MGFATLTAPASLLSGATPTAALASMSGTAPQLPAGDLVQVSDPPTTIAGYTLATTSRGDVGWLPTSSLSLGPTGSTLMNFGLLAALGIGIYWFMFRK